MNNSELKKFLALILITSFLALPGCAVREAVRSRLMTFTIEDFAGAAEMGKAAAPRLGDKDNWVQCFSGIGVDLKDIQKYAGTGGAGEAQELMRLHIIDSIINPSKLSQEQKAACGAVLLDILAFAAKNLPTKPVPLL